MLRSVCVGTKRPPAPLWEKLERAARILAGPTKGKSVFFPSWAAIEHVAILRATGRLVWGSLEFRRCRALSACNERQAPGRACIKEPYPHLLALEAHLASSILNSFQPPNCGDFRQSSNNRIIIIMGFTCE